MKVQFSFAFYFGLLSFAKLSLACKCKEPTPQDSLINADAVFRGNVTRELKTNDDNQKMYVVTAWRAFKGCNFKGSNRTVIVTTGSESASCGVPLELNTNYVFSANIGMPMDAATRNQLGKNTKISQVYSIFSCNYNRVWKSVPEVDKEVFRQHSNQCAATTTKCETGADCPDNHFCDTGTCVAYDAQCPDGMPVGACIADPCEMSKPCTEAKCHASYCGGCFAIFVDPTGTRVCTK